MEKIIKLAMGLLTVLVLSACSSQGNKIINDTNTESLETNVGTQTENDRYRMIVLPTLIDLAGKNNFPVSPSALSNTLSHEISTALYETRRFDVLSTELQSTPDGERIENNNIDTDFYLKSILNQIDTQETIKILKTTGQGVEEKTVSATILYQIVDSKSNKVVFSRSLRYQLKSTANNETLTELINNTVKSLANLMKNEVINELYPIRVLRADNEEIILDYPLPIYSQCEVIRLGEKARDGYTDNVLGYEQRVVGKLLIIQNSSVLAYGQLIDGLVEKGDACKPLQTTVISIPELVNHAEGDDVVLPFDYNK